MASTAATSNAASRILSNPARFGSSSRNSLSSRLRAQHQFTHPSRSNIPLSSRNYSSSSARIRRHCHPASARSFASTHESCLGNPRNQEWRESRSNIDRKRIPPSLSPGGILHNQRPLFLPIPQSPIILSRQQLLFQSFVSNNHAPKDHGRVTNSNKVDSTMKNWKQMIDCTRHDNANRSLPMHSISFLPPNSGFRQGNYRYPVSLFPSQTTTTTTTPGTRNFYSVTIASWSRPIVSSTVSRSLTPIPTILTRGSSRSFSTGKNNDPKNEIQGEKQASDPNKTNGNSSESNKIKEFMASTASTVRTTEATIKRAVEELSTGDLVSVYGIVFLIVVLAGAPTLIKRLQSPDGNTSYDVIDPEDPVMDLARMIRGEYLETLTKRMTGDEETDTESSEGGDESPKTGSSMGLDRIVADLLKSPQIQEAATTLVTKVLQSPQFKTACQLLLKELLKDLLEDPDTLKQVIHLLQHAIADEKIKEAAIRLATDIFGDDRVLDELVTLVQRLGMEKQVMHATQALLVESAHNALNDPEILDHSMEFATDVVGDDVVQQTAGEALYNTMSYAFRPALSVVLAVTGVGLIFVSLSAFRNVSQTPSDAADRAFLDAVETTTSRLLKFIFLPIDFLIACKDALVALVLFPFRMVSSGITRASKLGETLFRAATSWLLWFLHLPFDLFSSFLDRSRVALDTTCTHMMAQLSVLIGGAQQVLGNVCAILFERWNVVICVSKDVLGTSCTIAMDQLNILASYSKNLLDAACANLLDRVGTVVSAADASFATLIRQHFWNNLALSRIHLMVINHKINDRLHSIERFARQASQVVCTTWDAAFSKWNNLHDTILTHTATIQQQRTEYVDAIVRGYGSLNRSLQKFAFRVENMIRKVIPMR